MGARTSSNHNCCCSGSRNDEKSNHIHDELFLPVIGKFKELVPGDSYGCVIEHTEERGITMAQIQKLVQYIDNHCEAEKWTSSGPSAQQMWLNPASINLYDVVHWIVKPATQKRGCSFVELVASKAQIPTWFVSHWWGEPVKMFVKCLNQHSLDRSLTLESPYWVCAYANNQRQLANVDPVASAFRKAIELAKGTITILDRKSIVFSRVWCAYENFISLISHGTYNHLHDVYTADEHHEAVGLMDRSTTIDMNSSEYWFVGDRYTREKDFPLHLAEAALRVKVQAAEASRFADRRNILNAIVSRTDLEMPPFAEHTNYEVVNRLLRGRFAASTWLLAFERGRPMHAYVEALRHSGLQDFSAFIDSDVFSQAALRLLLDSVPLTVRTLELRLYGRQLGAASALIWRDALPTLQCLKSLTLDLCLNSLNDTGILSLGLALSSLSSLTSLTLYLSENNIGDAGMTWFTESIQSLALLTRLRLYLRKNRIGFQGMTHLADFLARCAQLTSLTVNLKENIFSPTGVAILARALRSQQLTRLARLELKLAYNKFGFEEALSLGDSLKSLLLLTHLALDFKSLYLEAGGAVLAEALGSLSQLTGLRLHLFENNFGEGATTLGQAFMHLSILSSLELELDMKDGSDGPKLLEPLLTTLPFLPKFRKFTLRLRESLGAKHAINLADELKTLSHLTDFKLDLQMNGATCLVKSVGDLSQLSHLHLQICEESESDMVVVAISDSLESLFKLSSFVMDVSVSSLEDETVFVLGDALKNLPSHTYTNVRVHERDCDTTLTWSVWNQCLELVKGFTSNYEQDVQMRPYWIT